ncbi:MAG: hypothetical protein KC503_22780, partial [Myxococcales bacterium]|nr:hypothetical protein [Myxococcales bacterium]
VLIASVAMWSTNVFAQGGGTPAAGDKKAGDAKAGDAKAGDAKAGDAAAGGAGGAAAGGAAAGDQAAAPSGGDYNVRLKQLEARVNELKERIFRSKARLNLLKETVLHGVIAGSRAIIKHKNEMGSSFRLVKLVYAVDGAQIFSKTDDSGSLDDKRDFQVFNGSIVPGNHTITVQMVFRGHGYGIFSYLKGYRFRVRSSHTFTAGEGRQTAITVRAFEKGNITTELKDRPAIKFETNLFKVGKKQ